MAFDSYPAEFDGSLAGAGADIEVATGACSAEIAPFGVRAPGPDQVIALRNLEPGHEYMVRLFSGSDLAFYVATSCSTAGGGPAPGQCLLYVDGSTRSPERGLFTAPESGLAFVVIDFFLSGDPADMEYSLEVWESECEDNSACSEGSSFCVDSRCVQCGNSFHCNTATAPVCDARDNVCGSAFSSCIADDASESGDDGPAGAVDITPGGVSQSANGNICNQPTEEADFYRFTVASPGEFFDVELGWADASADLDLEIFDDNGVRFGMSFWERPESVALTFLPAGTYYAKVQRFGAQSAVTTAYTVTATRQDAMTCSGADDCASEFDNQLFRGNCTGGACAVIEGDGGLGAGAACDSASDCASGLCTSFFFNADADTRSVCTVACSSDSQCGPLGGNFVCTDFLVENFCVEQCATDLHCPVLTAIPPATGPWHRLTCELSTGRCRL